MTIPPSETIWENEGSLLELIPPLYLLHNSTPAAQICLPTNFMGQPWENGSKQMVVCLFNAYGSQNRTFNLFSGYTADLPAPPFGIIKNHHYKLNSSAIKFSPLYVRYAVGSKVRFWPQT